MERRLSRVEGRLGEVDDALTALLARVSALERQAPELVAQNPAVAAPQATAEDSARDAPVSASPLLVLAGRTVVVLGGAFLLRAVTELGGIPLAGGVLLGLVYASIWIGAADRAAISRSPSGVFHGIAAIAIGFPLLFEAPVRFGAVSASWASALLAVFTIAVLAMAWHRRLPGLAAAATLASAVTALGLAAAAGHVLAFGLASMTIGLCASAIAIHRGWYASPWPPAIAATLLVAVVVLRAGAPAPLESAASALTAACLLAGSYFAIVMIHALVDRDGPRAGDVVRASLALVTGVGGALVVSRLTHPPLYYPLAFALLGVGLAGHAALQLPVLDRRPRALPFSTSVMTASVLVGCLIGFEPAIRNLLLAAVALALLHLGGGLRRHDLYLQGVVAAVAGAAAAGVLGVVVDAWIGGSVGSFPPATSLLLAAALVDASRGPNWKDDAGIEGAVAATTWILRFVAVAVTGAIGLVTIQTIVGTPITPALLPAGRSLMIAAIAIVLGLIARTHPDARFKSLMYAVLAVGALKLVLEDMTMASAVALFTGFAAYGLALIVCAKMLPVAGLRYKPQ